MLGFVTGSRVDYAEAAGLLDGVELKWIEDPDSCCGAARRRESSKPLILRQGPCVRPCQFSSHCTVETARVFDDELAQRAALRATAACRLLGRYNQKLWIGSLKKAAYPFA